MMNLLVNTLMAQAQFVSVLGGTGWDVARDIVQTPDRGFAVAGYTESFGAGGYDIVLSRFDSSGNHLWTRTAGGTGDEYGYSLVVTSDGGFVVAGYTASFGVGTNDVILCKFNSSGDHLWSKTVGRTPYYYGYSLVATSDGGLAITGGANVSAEILLTRFDSLGNHMWTRTVGGFGEDVGYSLIQTTDGGFAVAGWTTSFGGVDNIVLARFNASGNHMWTRSVDGTSSEAAYSLVQTSDGGFAVAGWTTSFGAGGGADIMLTKFDDQGNHLWTRTVGGTNPEIGYSLIQSLDECLVVAGFTSSFGTGLEDIMLTKFDDQGNHLWTRTMGGTSYDEVWSLLQASDGGFVLAGQTWGFGAGEYDIILAKFDTAGNACMGGFVSPTVTFPDPVVTSPTTMDSTPTPTITSPNPTITSPIPRDTVLCYSPVSIEESFPWPGFYLRIEGDVILFFLPENMEIRLSVYDPAGRLIVRPFEGFAPAGKHEVSLGLDRGV